MSGLRREREKRKERTIKRKCDGLKDESRNSEERVNDTESVGKVFKRKLYLKESEKHRYKNDRGKKKTKRTNAN